MLAPPGSGSTGNGWVPAGEGILWSWLFAWRLIALTPTQVAVRRFNARKETAMAATPEISDLSDQIAHEHQVIDGILAILRSDRDDRFILAHRLLDEVGAHMSAVTQVLLPALRDIVPGGVEMSNRTQSDLADMRQALAALEAGHPGDPDFEEAVAAVAESLGRYRPVQENEHLPALRSVIGAEAMAELGRIYAQVKDHTPGGLPAMPAGERNPTFRLG